MNGWRHLPNVISVLRLCTVPVLIWLAWIGAELPFAWLLVVAGFSDVLDGWLARSFGWVSKTGAVLDSIADITIVVVVLFAIWNIHPYVYTDHGWVIWAVLTIWAVANFLGLGRYKRVASFHTASARFALITFGVFVLLLFFYGFVPWLFYFSGAICFLAGVESLILVLMVDEWRPNLRGGLVAILRERSERSRNSQSND